MKAKDIYLRVRGYERAGEHHGQVLRSFKKTMLKASGLGKGSPRGQEMLDVSQSFKRANTNLAYVYGPGLEISGLKRAAPKHAKS